MTRKLLFRIVLSLVLTALLVAAFLYNVDFSELGRAFGTADTGLITLAAVIGLASYWLRALRWQIILRSAGRTRHSTAVLAIATGYAAMALLPARAGDIIRPVLLARRDRLSTSASLASIVTERIFDMATVVFFFVVFTIWPPAMSIDGPEAQSHLEILKISGYIVALGLLFGICCLLGLFRYQTAFIEIMTRPVVWIRASWRQPATNFLNHFMDGLRVLKQPRDLMLTVSLSLVIWFVIYWQVHITLRAFDLIIPLRGSFLLITLSVIGLAIPTPGGVGGFHKAMQIGLTGFFAVDLASATAIAIAYHATCFIPITIIGLLCLPIFGLSLREVSQLSAEPAFQSGEENEP